MKGASQFVAVLVTAPDAKTAQRLARAALQARLVACANLLPKLESHYWWKGKVESSAEVLLVFKTAKTKLKRLEKVILQLHPYDTPEFLVLPFTLGNERYLAWISNSLKENRVTKS